MSRFLKKNVSLGLITAAIAFGCFLLPASALAATITSTGSGNWNAATTWVGGVVPTAADAVVIASGHTVTISNTPHTITGLTITGILDESVANTLTINGNVSGGGTIQSLGNDNFDLNFTGDWSFSGTINATTNKIRANPVGSGDQTMSATLATFYQLNINKSGGTLFLNGPVTTSSNVTLTAGTIDPNSNLFTIGGTLSVTGGKLIVNTATYAGNYSKTDTSPAAGTTIEYTNANPTVNVAVTYQNLAFSGSGTAGASGTPLKIQGNLTNIGGGTLNFGFSAVTLSGIVVANSIAGFTTTGLVSKTKTAGTATFTGNVNGGGLTISGSGILNLGIALTHTFTGVVTLTAGTLNGGSSTLNENAVSATAWNGTGSVFSAGTGTVNFGAAGAQTISASGTSAFNNISFSGSGIKTMPTATTVGGNFSVSGTATAHIPNAANIGVTTITLGSLGRINGTWGSTSSTATNQNNTYFAATTGRLTVTTDTRTTPTINTLPSATGITYGQALSASMLSGGSVSVAGSFAFTTPATTPNAGTYSASVTFTPTDATSYTTVIGSVDVAVAKASLTITAQTNTKVYDSTMSAVVLPIASGMQGTDTVTGLAETYDTKNVGTGKTLSVSAYTVNDGNSGGNYDVTLVTNTTGEITVRAITVTAATDIKTYDRTVNSSATPTITLGALQGTDVANFSETFDTKDSGITKILTPTGSVSDDNGGNNYGVAFVDNTTGIITALLITGNITADNKIYDATDTATILTRTLSGVISGDTVTYTGGTATFNNKNVGTVKTVTGTGLGLSGGDAGNYTVNDTALTTADITALAITGNITADSKIYDGTNSATISGRSLLGMIAPDVVNYIGGTATFDNENVAAGKVVTGTGLSLSGTDAGNYTVNAIALTNADITKRDLIVSAVGINKVYDATTNAMVTLTTDALIGDDVTASDSASFVDENAGTGKPVSVSGISISGIDAGNYTLTNTIANTTADITPKVLTVSATADSKTYDATTDAVAHLTTNAISGDDVTPAYVSASFVDKNIGTGKIVSVSGITISGDVTNYTFNASTTATADITALAIIGTVTADNKEYDGIDTATILARDLSGVLLSDDVHYTGGTATFDTKNVGTGKLVSAIGLSLSGTDAGNYTVNTTPTTNANIMARPITVTASTNTKTYDGTVTAAATPSVTSGMIVTGDTESFTETYDTPHVGTGKTMTPAGMVTDGNSGNNYAVTFVNDMTGVIGTLAITATADAKTKIYNTTDPVLTYVVTGTLVIGDTFSGSLSRSVGENIGTYPINKDTLALSSDYALTYVGADLTITTSAVTVTADAQSKTYGDADPVLTYLITSGALATGDLFIGDLTRDPGDNAGTHAITQGTLALNSNYVLTYAGADLTINKATPTITWTNPADITYPTPLSATELNAIASVPGVFTYNPAETTVLNAGNNQQMDVNFVPTDITNYNNASATVHINVLKADPIITWANPSNIVAGAALGGSELNAIANVGGVFTYNPLSGTVLTVAGSHALHVDFIPTDTINYNNADADVSVTVVPAEIVALNLVGSPTSLAFDQTSEITVTGKDQYGNTVTNNSSTVAVLSADGGGSLVDTLLTLNAGIAITHLSKDSIGTVHVTVQSGVLSPAQTTVIFTATDTSSPFVESHTPIDGATSVALTVQPTLTFSESLNATTINSTNIQLRKASDDSVIPATVSMAEGVRRVIIAPTSPLDFGTDYYFAVSAGVTDMVGNPAVVLDSSTKIDHTFTTVTDTTVLGVTQISAVNTFATADNTFDNGWKWVFDITVPTAETQLQMKFADWIGTSGSIPAADNIRYYSAQSSNADASTSAITVVAADTYAGSMDLTQDLNVSQSGRQVRVTVEARVPTTAAGGSYSTSYGAESH